MFLRFYSGVIEKCHMVFERPWGHHFDISGTGCFGMLPYCYGCWAWLSGLSAWSFILIEKPTLLVVYSTALSCVASFNSAFVARVLKVLGERDLQTYLTRIDCKEWAQVALVQFSRYLRSTTSHDWSPRQIGGGGNYA